MISALSHQLRLSGSKLCLLVFLFFGLASCGSTKKIPTRTKSSTTNTRKPKTKRSKTRVKKDTVQWKEVNTSIKKGKTSTKTKYGTNDKKSHYDVAMLIPLEANRSGGNKRMVNYYAGVKMALDKLDEEGASLTLHTTDVSSTGSITSRLRDINRNGVDVIIGPYAKADLKAAAEFARKEEITLVSPWIALSSKTIKGNPQYIQMKPSQLDHYEKMIEHVSENYKSSQVVLLGQEGNTTDQKRSRYLQKLGRTYYKSSQKNPFQEFYISKDSLMESRMLYIDYLQPGQTTVFVIPQTNSRDEDFVYGAMRRLTAEKGESNVVVYGMPIVKNSDRITFDNYHGTNAHVVTSSFVDAENPEIKDFKSQYFRRYGAIPDEAAYEGYDMMLYVGRALMKHGSSFQYKMDQDYDKLLQTRISLSPKYAKGNENLSSAKGINYFVNKHIDVIKFKDSRFVRD